MKTNVTGKQNTHPQTKSNNRPENKNTLDSREGEEQLVNDENVTHNKKEKHSEIKNKKEKD